MRRVPSVGGDVICLDGDCGREAALEELMALLRQCYSTLRVESSSRLGHRRFTCLKAWCPSGCSHLG